MPDTFSMAVWMSLRGTSCALEEAPELRERVAKRSHNPAVMVKAARIFRRGYLCFACS